MTSPHALQEEHGKLLPPLLLLPSSPDGAVGIDRQEDHPDEVL
jgi:hypothetical protein